jgi:hypothetical protein
MNQSNLFRDSMDRSRLVEVLNYQTGDCKIYFQDNKSATPTYAGKGRIPVRLLNLNEKGPNYEMQKDRIGYFRANIESKKEEDLPDLFNDPDFDAFK